MSSSTWIERPRLSERTRVSLRLRHLSQIIEGEKPRAVAITPQRLHGIAADHRQPLELKRGGRERLVRVLVEVAHDIHLALAAGAGTMAAQFFELHKALAAIVPFD